MERADQNPLLTKFRPIEDIFKGRVLHVDRPPRDRTVNEDIEEFGAHLGGGSRKPTPGSDSRHEVQWYKQQRDKSNPNVLNRLSRRSASVGS